MQPSARPNQKRIDRKRRIKTIAVTILPRPRWRGFSFALHLLRVQGFSFALLQYNTIQAFTAAFIPSMQLYRQRRKTAHRALQALFLRFAPFYRHKY
nr:MAG TPA: hypothetical protein [Caudoviricetes sp.]